MLAIHLQESYKAKNTRSGEMADFKETEAEREEARLWGMKGIDGWWHKIDMGRGTNAIVIRR